MEENFQRLKEEGREEEITALLDGDEAVFFRIKKEDMRLREDNTVDYNQFVSNYIDTFYAFRYNMKKAGVIFPKEDDDLEMPG